MKKRNENMKVGKMGASTQRQSIRGYLFGEMYPSVKKSSSTLLLGPYNVFLPNNEANKGNSVQPDICLVSDPSKIAEQGLFGSPDLLVEICDQMTGSEGSERFMLYESCGVWEVFPEAPGILVHHQYRDGHYQLTTAFGRSDKISPTGFPDVTIDLEEMFAALH